MVLSLDHAPLLAARLPDEPRATRWLVAPSRVDVLVGVGLLAYGIVQSSGGYGPRDGLDVAMLLVVSAAVVVRRSSPETVLAVFLAARIAQDAMGREQAYPTWAMSIALFTVVAMRPVWVGVGAAVVIVCTFLLASGSVEFSLAFVGSTFGFFGPSYGAGRVVRRLDQLNRQAEAAAAELAAGAQAREQMAVAEERSRLRDDLHDIVGHHVNVAAVLADAARAAQGRDEQRVAQSLDAIGVACRTALEQMDRATGWLGLEQGLEPTPSIADYPELVASVRPAGLVVDAAVTVSSAEIEQVGGVASATAYRFLREALTNVLKHSARRWCRIELSREGAWLRVAVVSAPAASALRTSGTGLRQLRRRVEMIGGTVEVDATPTSFTQTAMLPFGQA